MTDLLKELRRIAEAVRDDKPISHTEYEAYIDGTSARNMVALLDALEAAIAGLDKIEVGEAADWPGFSARKAAELIKAEIRRILGGEHGG